MRTPEVSIVIPFKNEKLRLPATLKSVRTYAARYFPSFEIILVDDGSDDGSAQAVASFLKANNVRLLTHEQNMGKGAAIRTGVLNAKGRFVLFTDADLATPIKELRRLVEAINENGCDVVIGSRAVSGSNVTASQPWMRVVIGKTGNLLIRAILGLPFRDTQCGFKLFTCVAAKDLFAEQKFPRWSFDIEILLKAVRRNYRVCEVPVEWHDVSGSKVRPVRDSLRVFFDVLKMRFTRLS